MFAAPRTFQQAAGTRNLGAALFAVLLAIALVALLAFGLGSAKVQSAPAAGSAPAAHDHGWSSAPSVLTAPAAHDHGWSDQPTGGGIRIEGRNGGGIQYTGIPYTPAGDPGSGGRNPGRYAQ